MTMSILRPRKAQIEQNHHHFVYYRNRTRCRVLQLMLQISIRFYKRSLPTSFTSCFIYILYGIFQRVSEFAQTNVEFLKRKAIRKKGRSTSGKSVPTAARIIFLMSFNMPMILKGSTLAIFFSQSDSDDIKRLTSSKIKYQSTAISENQHALRYITIRNLCRVISR